MNTPIDSLLGKTTAYAEYYDPSLLFPIPRQSKRDELAIVAGNLPFVGHDLWNAYELSWLNPKGKPQVALAQFWVPADTPFLIESKSLKLYLNSLNQTVFADQAEVLGCLQNDLSAAAGGVVRVDLQNLSELSQRQLGVLPGVSLDELDVACTHYQPDASLLRVCGQSLVHETLRSHLLKSNCLVTGQPDWASVVIEYAGLAIDHASLLQYIVSFRQHNEFHEQCVERIFTDILNRCRPTQLSVWARYTRRGGLDINPWRSTHADFGRPGNVFDVRQ